MSAMILLAAHTGMRRGELCGLKWEDVSEGRIVIRRSLAAVRGGASGRRAARTYPEFVFTTDSGLPINPSNLSRDWKRWCERNKIDGRMRLHDLRGSFVSLLLESGADIRTVQELARHADSRTTMKVYARSRMDTKVAAVELLRGTITEDRVQDRVQSGALEVSVAGA
jgi:integrase